MNMKRYIIAAAVVLFATAAAAQAPVQLCVPSVNAKTGTKTCSFGLNLSSKTALTASVVPVKATSGVLGSVNCYNPSNANAFVQVFDNAGTVTLGTTVPDAVFGTATLTIMNYNLFYGLVFSNAIQVAATTTATGNSAPSVALVCIFGYK